VRSLARRPSGAFYNFNVAGIVDMLGGLPEVAHIEPCCTDRAFHEERSSDAAAGGQVMGPRARLIRFVVSPIPALCHVPRDLRERLDAAAIETARRY
jgi:hypothetical protein